MEQSPAPNGAVLSLEPALSWSAIIAGGLVALSTSMFLTLLAAGLGFDLASGGIESRASLSAFTPELGAGAIAIQVIAAGFGGYLAGRLRHPWLSAHTDEAHFRDTAHGLITWALATIAGLMFAAIVVTPYAEQLAGSITPAALAPADADRAAHILVQSAFFTAVGMVLSAFTATIAARIGGLRNEEMHQGPRH